MHSIPVSTIQNSCSESSGICPDCRHNISLVRLCGGECFRSIQSVILNSLLNVPVSHTLAKYTPEKAASHALHMVRKLGPHFLNVPFYFQIDYLRSSEQGIGSSAISHLSGSVATKGKEAGASSSVYIWLRCSINLYGLNSLLVTNGLKQVELTYSPISLPAVSPLQASFQMILRVLSPPINFFKQAWQS